MPVLRLIGDEWKFSEKIALSIPASKSFLMCATQLKDKLQIPSWNGCALYWTEGKPPNYIRATVPVPLQSTPGREGMKDGVILYVKSKSTQAQQQQDKEFHEALLEWRKENKIDGILSDGSDVFEFMDEYASKLKPSAARDISEHEGERRAIVQGEEHRAFFVVTFEYREVQNMKDAEADARRTIEDAYEAELRSAYKQHVWLPRCAFQRRTLQDATEPTQRESILREEETSRATKLEAEHRRLAQQLTDGQRKDDDRPPQHVSSTSTTVLGHTAASSSSNIAFSDAGDRLGQLEASFQKETREIRSLMSSLVESNTQASEHLARSYAQVSTTLEAQFLRQLEASLKATIALKEQNVRAPLDSAEEQALERKIKALKGLVEEELRGIEDQRITIARAECDTVKHIAASVLAEQESLREGIALRMRQLSATEEALQKAEEDNMELGRLLKIHHVLLQHQDVELQRYKAALSRHEELIHQGALATTSFAVNEVRWSAASTSADLAGTAGLHPDVYSTCFQLVQRRESIPEHIYHEVLGYPLGFPARNPDPLSPEERLIHDDSLVRNSGLSRKYFMGILSELALVAQGCPYQVGDELCFRYQLPSHPLRAQYAKAVDDELPHMAGVLDALLDVFAGREAELMLCIIGSSWTAEEFQPCWDNTAQRHYYHHPRCQVTQWVAPHRAEAFRRF